MKKFLFSVTSRVLLPRIPTSASAHFEQNQEKYAEALHSAMLLTKEAFTQRLYSFSRSNFDREHSEGAFVQLLELSRHRVLHVSPKVLHEHMHLAAVAGFHSLCVEIFYRSLHHEAQLFMLSEHVIDSAYALKSSRDLLQMASYCASRMAEGRAKGQAREIIAEFCLLRIFWRLGCLHEIEAYTSGIEQIAPSGADEVPSHASAGGVLFGDIKGDAETVFDLLRTSLPPESRVSNLVFSYFFRLMLRLIKYDTSGDDGEMAFFKESIKREVLVDPVKCNKAEANEESVGNGSLPANTIPMLSTKITERELFYAVLIGTCTVGRHVSVARGYYEILRQRMAGESALERSNDSSPPLEPQIAEFVVYRLLSVLQSNKENKAITEIARELIHAAVAADEGSSASISISVWSILLVSAGETRAGDVALFAYHTAMQQLEELSNNSIHSSGLERRGVQYLLQTSINALSKCQIASFEEKYLQPARASRALHCTDEFYYSCLLQEAHNSMNPLDKTRNIIEEMNRESVPLTERLISRLLKIYLRAEADEYFALYQRAVVSNDEEVFKGAFHRQWLEGLLLWADRRRYALTQEQRKYIIDETHSRLGPNPTERLGGLRTQFSLLSYDYTEQPCRHFQEKGCPPGSPPVVQDPRVHFLLRRPSNVSRGVWDASTSFHGGYGSHGSPSQGLVGLSAGCGAEPKSEVSRIAYLAARPLVVPSCSSETEVEAFRVFLTEALRALQRSNNFVR